MLTCSVCGQEFERYPAHIRRVQTPTCSRECNGALRGAEWAQHGHKGRAGWTDASSSSNAEKMSGERNPAWKGGVTHRRGKGNYAGARYVRAPDWAKPMARADGYVMEHRLVLAARCCFLLTRSEVVHHLDHHPRHNSPENLELWPTNGDHKAAEAGRFRDGVCNRWHPREEGIPTTIAEPETVMARPPAAEYLGCGGDSESGAALSEDGARVPRVLPE